MKDNNSTGALIGLGYFIIVPSISAWLFSLNIGVIAVIISYALAAMAFIIPIVLYVKGFRKAMKVYLLTLFIPTLAVLLLFGSCMLFLGL